MKKSVILLIFSLLLGTAVYADDELPQCLDLITRITPAAAITLNADAEHLAMFSKLLETYSDDPSELNYSLVLKTQKYIAEEAKEGYDNLTANYGDMPVTENISALLLLTDIADIKSDDRGAVVDALTEITNLQQDFDMAVGEYLKYKYYCEGPDDEEMSDYMNTTFDIMKEVFAKATGISKRFIE